MAVLGELDPKLSAEKVFINADFTDLFDASVTISSATVVSAAFIGTDASANTVCNGSCSLDPTSLIASKLAQNGVAGCTYLLTFTANGSDGSIQVVELLLPVTDQRLG